MCPMQPIFHCHKQNLFLVLCRLLISNLSLIRVFYAALFMYSMPFWILTKPYKVTRLLTRKKHFCIRKIIIMVLAKSTDLRQLSLDGTYPWMQQCLTCSFYQEVVWLLCIVLARIQSIYEVSTLFKTLAHSNLIFSTCWNSFLVQIVSPKKKLILM